MRGHHERDVQALGTLRAQLNTSTGLLLQRAALLETRISVLLVSAITVAAVVVAVQGLVPLGIDRQSIHMAEQMAARHPRACGPAALLTCVPQADYATLLQQSARYTADLPVLVAATVVAAALVIVCALGVCLIGTGTALWRGDIGWLRASGADAGAVEDALVTAVAADYAALVTRVTRTGDCVWIGTLCCAAEVILAAGTIVLRVCGG